MAKNPPKGHGRKGEVKAREQVLNPRNERWTKKSAETGRFMDVKYDKLPFRGIKKK
jgi:hypothetical protein